MTLVGGKRSDDAEHDRPSHAAERNRCENCDYTTNRQCGRCGQRICRGCAKDHPRRNYDDPPELWKKCRLGLRDEYAH